MITTYILQAGGFGSEARTTYGIPTKDGIYVRCGCWSGTIDEFRQRVENVYQGKDYYDEYMAVIALFKAAYKRIMKKVN